MLLLAVGVYLVVLLAIGWWAQRTRVAGVTDYLLAGRRLGPVLGAAALAATHFGGGAVVGGAAYGFEHGLAGVWYGLAAGIGLLALGLLTAERFRALALTTVPDWLEHRFAHRGLRRLAAALSLAALVGILAAQVNAARGAFALTGIDPTVAAVLATVVFIAYTAAGGLWAATISDLLQLVVAGGGVALAAAAVLRRTAADGGLAPLLAGHGVGSGFLDPLGPGPAFLLVLLVPTVMYTLIGQDFYQRLFATRDRRTARTAALAGGAVLLVLSFFPVLVGIGVRALGTVADPAAALPWALRNLLPPLLGGVVLAAVLAAIMSTADSLLTSATSHVVWDLWLGGGGGEPDERRLLAVSRWVTLVVGVAALLLGLAAPGIVGLLVASYTLYTAGVFVPVMGGLLWRRATAAGALAALLAGTAAAAVGLLTGVSPGGVPLEVAAAGLSAVVLVAVSLATGSGGRSG